MHQLLFTSSKNIDPSRSYSRVKVSTYALSVSKNRRPRLKFSCSIISSSVDILQPCQRVLTLFKSFRRILSKSFKYRFFVMYRD